MYSVSQFQYYAWSAKWTFQVIHQTKAIYLHNSSIKMLVGASFLVFHKPHNCQRRLTKALA